MPALQVNRVYVCTFKKHKSLFRVDAIEEKQVHTTDLKYNLKSTLPASLIEYCMKQGNIQEYTKAKGKKKIGSSTEDQEMNKDEMWKRDNFYNFILALESLGKKYGIVVSSEEKKVEPFFVVQQDPNDLKKLEYIGNWSTGKMWTKATKAQASVSIYKQCPYCDSESIKESGKFDMTLVDPTECVHDFECDDCEGLWTITYAPIAIDKVPKED